MRAQIFARACERENNAHRGNNESQPCEMEHPVCMLMNMHDQARARACVCAREPMFLPTRNKTFYTWVFPQCMNIRLQVFVYESATRRAMCPRPCGNGGMLHSPPPTPLLLNSTPRCFVSFHYPVSGTLTQDDADAQLQMESAEMNRSMFLEALWRLRRYFLEPAHMGSQE